MYPTGWWKVEVYKSGTLVQTVDINWGDRVGGALDVINLVEDCVINPRECEKWQYNYVARRQLADRPV